MTRQFQISIPEPCHEQWSGMQPTEKGAFCKTCAKEVMDFSKMSEEELIRFFADHQPEQPLCGHFRKEQLGLYTIEVDAKVFQLDIPLWKKILAVIIICFGQMVFSNAHAQVKTTTVKTKSSYHAKKKKGKKKPVQQIRYIDTKQTLDGFVYVERIPPIPSITQQATLPGTDTLYASSRIHDSSQPELPKEEKNVPNPVALFKNEAFIPFQAKRKK